jgi:hypothetical protein
MLLVNFSRLKKNCTDIEVFGLTFSKRNYYIALAPLTMQDLKTIETSVLIDILAQETTRFGQLFRNYTSLKNSQEYQSCKKNIQYLVLELHNRKKSSKDTEAGVSKDSSQADSNKNNPLSHSGDFQFRIERKAE